MQRHGPAKTLREMLAQEGSVMARAREMGMKLHGAEIATARKIIAPHLDSADRPRVLASLFGDAAAQALGYEPLGLPERAGFAVALADAREKS